MTEFSYVNQPCDNFSMGMYTRTKRGVPPKEFEPFEFIIESAPDMTYDIFNIPAHVMFKAVNEAGFNSVDYKLQYSNPDFREHPAVRKYIDECNAPDYIMRMKVIE